MSNPTFMFRGRIYNARVGEIITIKNDTSILGDGIKISTGEYEIYAQKISSSNNTTILRIEKVDKAIVPVPVIPPEELQVSGEDLPDKPNLSKFTKAQLIEFAQNIGIELSNDKITKKAVIELINQEYSNYEI